MNELTKHEKKSKITIVCEKEKKDFSEQKFPLTIQSKKTIDKS